MGEQEAFENSGPFDGKTLEGQVERYGREMMLYALTLTRHREDAEDVLQEALARIFAKQPSGILNWKAYLFRAVRNAALNGIRRRGRAARREAGAVCGFFIEPASRQEELEALNGALAGLADEQREVVVMKVWGGLTFDQIAQTVGIPRDTAASRYRYAMEALKEKMRGFFNE
jgi:RNA polymerase sigma-70 factor (ECF subfamily)